MGIKGSWSRVRNRKAYEENIRKIFMAHSDVCGRCGGTVVCRSVDDEDFYICADCGALNEK
jgi:formamidopyrimidine-DNA glycosylase